MIVGGWTCSDTLGYRIYLVHMHKYQLQHCSHDNISGQNHLYTICSVIESSATRGINEQMTYEACFAVI